MIIRKASLRGRAEAAGSRTETITAAIVRAAGSINANPQLVRVLQIRLVDAAEAIPVSQETTLITHLATVVLIVRDRLQIPE